MKVCTAIDCRTLRDCRCRRCRRFSGDCHRPPSYADLSPCAALFQRGRLHGRRVVRLLSLAPGRWLPPLLGDSRDRRSRPPADSPPLAVAAGALGVPSRHDGVCETVSHEKAFQPPKPRSACQPPSRRLPSARGPCSYRTGHGCRRRPGSHGSRQPSPIARGLVVGRPRSHSHCRCVLVHEPSAQLIYRGETGPPQASSARCPSRGRCLGRRTHVPDKPPRCHRSLRPPADCMVQRRRNLPSETLADSSSIGHIGRTRPRVFSSGPPWSAPPWPESGTTALSSGPPRRGVGSSGPPWSGPPWSGSGSTTLSVESHTTESMSHAWVFGGYRVSTSCCRNGVP